MLKTSDLIKYALEEDIPNGDITTDALELRDRKGRAVVVAKEDLVLSGSFLFTQTFQQLDAQIEVQWLNKDGEFILRGQKICLLSGALAPLLKGERVALNFLGMLSGIATVTQCFVHEIRGTKTKILDTRKTTPLMREHQRAAVRHGGGENHRLNLSDRVLIKENHIKACGSITKAIELTRTKSGSAIEVEVRNLEEVKQALKVRPDILLLDNMTNEEMAEALRLIPATVKTEASGNMNIDRVRSVAELGVDFISVGMITHSAPCADLSMLFEDLRAT